MLQSSNYDAFMSLENAQKSDTDSTTSGPESDVDAFETLQTPSMPSITGISNATPEQILYLQRTIGNAAVVRMLNKSKEDSGLNAPNEKLQRVTDTGGKLEEKHILAGNFFRSDAIPAGGNGATPVVVELMEGFGMKDGPKKGIAKMKASIQNKLQAFITTPRFLNGEPTAFVFAVNTMIGNTSDDVSKYSKKEITQYMGLVSNAAAEIAAYMEGLGVPGGCFPMIWAPTSLEEGGYTFPFLEARASLTLHPGVASVHDMMEDFGSVVVRSADADIQADPLITGRNSEELEPLLKEVEYGNVSIMSGGYDWSIDDVNLDKLASLGIPLNNDGTQPDLGNKPMLDFLKSVIAIINYYEHETRESITKISSHKNIYWPEPNSYMPLYIKRFGSNDMISEARSLHTGDAQQKESTFIVNREEIMSGLYDSGVATHKPLKDYFDGFIRYIAAVRLGTEAPSADVLRGLIQGIRQTHLDAQKVKDVMKWQNNTQSSDYFDTNLGPIIEGNLTQCVDDILARLEG